MKKSYYVYFGVYSFLIIMLCLPFILKESSVQTSTYHSDDSEKTTIELVADEVVVGFIQNYPGEKVKEPSSAEYIVNSYSSVEGWYLDKEYNNKYSFDYQPQENTTLYAKLDNSGVSRFDYSFYLFWGVSILSALGLGVLFFVLNRYYAKQTKVSKNNLNK